MRLGFLREHRLAIIALLEEPPQPLEGDYCCAGILNASDTLWGSYGAVCWAKADEPQVSSAWRCFRATRFAFDGWALTLEVRRLAARCYQELGRRIQRQRARHAVGKVPA